mgnify:CR=1 FL=1
MYAKLKTIILAFLIIGLTTIIILFPEDTLQASLRGLHTWWEIVFPSLLPFFIMAELLISFGVVQFIGILFEPIMRPLFNVPGAGSFAWILGMVSGFPSGAKITVMLRENNEVSKYEAERLLSFSNAASPLFIFGAIAVGFFHHVKLGIILALSHYVSNVIIGLAMRHHGRQKEDHSVEIRETGLRSFRFKHNIRRAFQNMHRTRIKETRPFGKLLGDAVIVSVQTLLMVGGFIILFSVLTALLDKVYFFQAIYVLLAPLLKLFYIPVEALTAVITGLFEITTGAEALSQTEGVALFWQLSFVSFILGFNGLSIHAQVASLIAHTDIRYFPYFFARIFHGFIAGFLTFLACHFFLGGKEQIIDTIHKPSSITFFISDLVHFFTHFGPFFTLLTLGLATSILLFRWLRSLY